ncbi:NAD(P)H-dependent oxidoreductase [Dactylosporangium sp. AC04546]|uniref:NADPH-dependent FMN reductase n=1 Tax=Dactylosporangium sp. AC04546 TaxID=2862460 RepID=UPI001EDD7BF7|nr:NAD(P)H-dependent oxidoreductase [Dactylosporangium sp. AC04546]WVK88839.1 NAD(P)H-dependent oxidoreductase [Dactylosporangium sp. AC04546]
MAPLKLAVIIGSTREGRVGETIGRRFAENAMQRDDLAVSVVDLAAYEFPGSYPAEPTAAIRSFVQDINRAEAFVVVTPEYNHSFPASLKQAIDYAYDEWQAKPVGFVSYGYRSTGLHAVDALRTVFTALHAVTVRDTVAFDLLSGHSEQVECRDQLQEDCRVLLDELWWWGMTLREGRAARPYVN